MHIGFDHRQLLSYAGKFAAKHLRMKSLPSIGGEASRKGMHVLCFDSQKILLPYNTSAWRRPKSTSILCTESCSG